MAEGHVLGLYALFSTHPIPAVYSTVETFPQWNSVYISHSTEVFNSDWSEYVNALTLTYFK